MRKKDTNVRGSPPIQKIPPWLRRGDPEDFDCMVDVEGHKKYNEALRGFYVATVGTA